MRKFEAKNTVTYSNFLEELQKEINKKTRLERIAEYLKNMKGIKVGVVEFSLSKDRPGFGDILESMNK